ncbi:hypothetical protein D3C86_2267000 [compost metagenome]
MEKTLSAYRVHDGMGTVRHNEAIERETKQTFAKYAKRWQLYTTKLGFLQPARGGLG